MAAGLLYASLAFPDPPVVGRALHVAAALRRATLLAYGPDAPPALSGHHQGQPARGHRHPFWLPVDADHDGRIDACWVIVPDASVLSAILRVRRLDPPWAATVTWHPAQPAAALQWASASPWVPQRFPHGSPAAAYRAQLLADCAERGWPAPTVLDAQMTPAWDHRPGWPAHHILWRVRFPTPILGPFALGRGAHMGVGLFLPQEVG